MSARDAASPETQAPAGGASGVAAGGATEAEGAPGRARRVALGLAFLAAVALLVALAIGLRRSGGGELAVGAPAPGFRLQTFDGETYALEDLRGRVVLLNFWASWCVECVVEAPALEAIARDYTERGVLVLGVDYTDTEAAALAYLAEHGVSYPNGPDFGSRISRAYGLTGVPETVLIDAEGRIVGLPGPDGTPAPRLVGAIAPGSPVTEPVLRALIDELLESPPESPPEARGR